MFSGCSGTFVVGVLPGQVVDVTIGIHLNGALSPYSQGHFQLSVGLIVTFICASMV